MDKFRLNLVPKGTKVNVRTLGEMRSFDFSYHGPDVPFETLRKAVASIEKVEISSPNRCKDVECYHEVNTEDGVIQIEINGGLIEQSLPNPTPTISIQTQPVVPKNSMVEDVKKIVTFLQGITGFKVFWWEKMDFVEADELYGR